MSKFKIGDVVQDINAESYPVYIIKETIKLMNGNMLTGYSYEVIPLNSSDEDFDIINESALSFLYHDTNWEEYFTESIGNGLPALRGKLYNYYIVREEGYGYYTDYRNDTIPCEYMRHILYNHSIYERIEDIIKDNKAAIMNKLGIKTDIKLHIIRDELIDSLEAMNLADTDILHPGRMAQKARIEFSPECQNLVNIVYDLDKKDIFPFKMTSLQIMQAIKEAYGTAYKVDSTKNQIETDERTGKSYTPVKGQRKYRGNSETYNNMLIEFWFDRDLKIITSAYPVFVDTTNRPDIRHSEDKN